MSRSLDVPPFRSARASHPRLVRVLNRVGGWFTTEARLDPDLIWDAAREKEGSDREPTPVAAEALQVLLDSLAKNVSMNVMGHFSARDDTIRMARTHLRLHAHLESHPELLETELPPPIFIVGWPRTGTTFLHQLLAADPANRTIPYWESFDPVPPPAGEADRRIERLDKMLGQLRFIAPNYDSIHPMTATSPEECVALFMNEFRTLQFDFQYHVPEYAQWLIEQDAGIAYDAYRRQLQLIHAARPTGERQVLKDPTHLVHFETLVERFPQARFVLTHRDPAAALSSICSLVAYTRSLFTDDVDPEAIGQELLEGYWVEALARSRTIAAALSPDRVVDVRHPELRADPVGTAEAVYRGLGLSFDEGARNELKRFLARRARERRGRHLHSLETFGLSRAVVRERLQDYCEAMDV